MSRRSKSEAVWEAIERAGGIRAYVDAQLSEQGFKVKRQATDNMSPRELQHYKKQLKDEAAEKQRIRKQAWQVYQDTHIVHLGDGVFWSDNHNLDRWDLRNAEERCAENELPTLDTPKQLAEALGLSIPQLRWLAFHREAATEIHYRRFTIPKRDGSPRAIWAPRTLLKKAQHWIYQHIAGRMLVHGAAHGFLPARSILTNAQVHTHSRIVLKMDLKDFFPTVSFRRVKGLFRKAGYREQVATLLALLTTEAPREVVEDNGKTWFVATGDRCLPQGAPTSPMLTNALCLKLDSRLSGIASKYGWRYSRYADDLTFSFPADSKEKPQLAALGHVVRQIVSAEGFTIHPDKTRITRQGSRQKVTGLVVNGDAEPRVPRQKIRQLRATIHNLQQGKPLRDGESYAQLQGYAAFIYMTNPKVGGEMLGALRALAAKLT